eukprot:3934783-Rhodomonas_salina.1
MYLRCCVDCIPTSTLLNAVERYRKSLLKTAAGLARTALSFNAQLRGLPPLAPDEDWMITDTLAGANRHYHKTTAFMHRREKMQYDIG